MFLLTTTTGIGSHILSKYTMFIVRFILYISIPRGRGKREKYYQN